MNCAPGTGGRGAVSDPSPITPMPAADAPTAPPDQFFGPGVAVDIPLIPRELKKLWQDSEGVATRASRLNLVIYSAAEHSLRENTAIVQGVAREHAHRAVIIAAKPGRTDGGDQPVRAWINAHCQISKAGAKQRCSEQIAFELRGEAARNVTLLESLVFSHLDSDLPLDLWWRGDLPASPPGDLFPWVDRLLVHSGEWAHPRESFATLREHPAFRRLHASLCDLNWTRLNEVRAAVAGLFDAPETGPEDLDRLDHVEIVHGPGVRLRAVLLLGWLAVRLGWTLPARRGEDPLAAGDWRGTMVNGRGETVAVTLRETVDGDTRTTLWTSAGGEFAVNRAGGSPFYTTFARRRPEDRPPVRVLPAGSDELADLVSEELRHTGHHRAYLRVIEAITPML